MKYYDKSVAMIGSENATVRLNNYSGGGKIFLSANCARSADALTLFCGSAKLEFDLTGGKTCFDFEYKGEPCCFILTYGEKTVSKGYIDRNAYEANREKQLLTVSAEKKAEAIAYVKNESRGKESEQSENAERKITCENQTKGETKTTEIADENIGEDKEVKDENVNKAEEENKNNAEDENKSENKAEDEMKNADGEQAAEAERILTDEILLDAVKDGFEGKIASINYYDEHLGSAKTLSAEEIIERLSADEHFYESVKSQFDELFARFKREEYLESVIENSSFCAVPYEMGKTYFVGLLRDEGEVKYIAYGVKSRFGDEYAMKCFSGAEFIPRSPEEPYGEGYYLRYQSAKSGKDI